MIEQAGARVVRDEKVDEPVTVVVGPGTAGGEDRSVTMAPW